MSLLCLLQSEVMMAAGKAAATRPTTGPVESSVGDRLMGIIPGHWPGQVDLLTWCENMGPGLAAVLVAAGIIYLLWGFLIYRALITLNAAVVGMVAGILIGDRMGNPAAGGIVGTLLAATLTWPAVKWAVSVMGGLYGAILGASIWLAFNQDPHFKWAGALTGLVFFGMLSFIVFRGSIIAYTSLQGSAMLVFGILGLVLKYHWLAPTVTRHMTLKPFVLPLAILIPTLFGLLYQQANHPPGQPVKK